MQQFMENMEKAKKNSKNWDENYRKRQQETLKGIEGKIKEVYDNNKEGVFNSKELEDLKKLEATKDGLLLQEEKKWRLKSRALSLAEGDQNTKFFHRYASQRKSINTIHEVKNTRGILAKTYEEKSKVVVEHFQELFKEPAGCLIGEMLEVLDLFPRAITEEMDDGITKDILEEEITQVLHSFSERKES